VDESEIKQLGENKLPQISHVMMLVQTAIFLSFSARDNQEI